jgi:hypothetical protein
MNIQELAQDKRLMDKMWRLEHLYFIQNKRGERVQFKLNRAQRHFLENKHTRNVIVKSRQLGFTTLEVIDMLDDVLFNENYHAIMRAHLDDLAEDIFQNKISFAWNNIPPQVKSLWKAIADRAKQLKFDFGNGTVSSIAVKGSGRSGTHQRAHISEYAKLCRTDPERANEVITGTFNSVPLWGRIDIESTAEGDYGDFYEIYNEAKGKDPELQTEFKAHFYNWTWDDEAIEAVSQRDIDIFKKDPRNEPFLEIQKKYKFNEKQITYYYIQWISMNKNWNRLRQEYPITDEEAFVASGFKEFDQEALSKQVLKDPIRKDGEWQIFEEFLPGKTYVMGADVAQGVGQDSSTAIVLKLGVKPEVAALYKNNKIDPNYFAFELKRIGINYGACLIAPERNNQGYSTISKLLEIYDEVYISPNENVEMEYRTKSTTPTMKYGFLTTASSKPYIIKNLKDVVNRNEIVLNSRILYDEIRSYDSTDLRVIRFNPEATKHWDLVMALAIAYEVMSEAVESSGGLDMSPIFYQTESYK